MYKIDWYMYHLFKGLLGGCEMLGTIERIKNAVLQKCNSLNDETMNVKLVKLIDTSIYQFAEELYSLINSVDIIDEDSLRNDIDGLIKKAILKKVKRKLFIDSLALQITNDGYIEGCVNGNVTLSEIKDEYINELRKNKNTNQLNMTEDLNMDEIFERLFDYIDSKIISVVKEDTNLVNAIKRLCNDYKTEISKKIVSLNKGLDNEYLNILVNQIKSVLDIEEPEENKGDEDMIDVANEIALDNAHEEVRKFDKYDDMTLYNKTILSLNTKEEQLTRQENKLAQRRLEIDKKLEETNKSIELNVERENKLSQRKLELNNKEIELSSKQSEVEVILLNMKPLLNGLSKISGGDNNE